jgi:hypothetical protein
MPPIPRALAPELQRSARHFSAIVLTGPRRAGKTTLLRDVFPKATYSLLEDPTVLGRVRGDPQEFLDSLRPPVILDEIQNAPELFPAIRARIDRAPSAKGRWILTGSQESPLMRNVVESMAGRAAVLQLLPLSIAESRKVSLISGGYPEAALRPKARDAWFRSYVLTYLERDVRAVTDVRDLSTFRRFLALLATRSGQMLNRTDLAAPLGVSVPTITSWIGVLEVTGIVLLVPPFYENLGKRLVKSPKVYFVDSGLACHLLGISTDRALRDSPFAGTVFEGFVASEIVKSQINAGRRRELYWFRDQQGLEVDFVVPDRKGGLVLVEAKAGRTVRPTDAAPAIRLASAAERAPIRRVVRSLVVHEGASTISALSPGARAVDVPGLLRELG